MEMSLYTLNIGLVMYMMLCTRPDVYYTLRIMNRYICNSSEGH